MLALSLTIGEMGLGKMGIWLFPPFARGRMSQGVNHPGGQEVNHPRCE